MIILFWLLKLKLMAVIWVNLTDLLKLKEKNPKGKILELHVIILKSLQMMLLRIKQIMLLWIIFKSRLKPSAKKANLNILKWAKKY